MKTKKNLYPKNLDFRVGANEDEHRSLSNINEERNRVCNTPENSKSKGKERIQKYLAHLGVASRREIERLIREGKITVNGEVAVLGTKVSGKEKITVDGKLIAAPRANNKSFRRRVIMYNKPEGEICTRKDPEGRPTVFDNLPKLEEGRWVSVGRLDINSAGLLLFTNDGEYAEQLMHPRYQLEREYAVRVYGEVTDQIMQNLLQGVVLEDGPAKFKSLYFKGGQGRNSWYHVVLMEGRNREVRRMWESQGITVSRLIRIRLGAFLLPHDLHEGMWKEIHNV